LIFVGLENFTQAQLTQVTDSVNITRRIYQDVQLGIRDVNSFFITAAQAGANETIDNAAECTDLTSDWTVQNGALDVFVVRVMTDADGRSPVNGPCNKNAKGMTGPVVSINGSTANSGNTFAHEIGHYLGLDHIADASNFIGGNGASDSNTGILQWQGDIMKRHCSVRPD
jgi:hypothetical protein